jgi:hypothetical protein
MARGTAANTEFGPGTLYWAPLGTTEPNSLTGALPSGWTLIGYTLQGSEFRTNPTVADLDVEEEKEPLGTDTQKVVREVHFVMGETTLTNLALSENADPATAIDGSNVAFDAFEPPDVGQEVDGYMICWTAEHGKRRRWYRQVKQTGTATESHRKGQLQGYDVTFRAFKPSSGLKSYKELRAKAA